MGREPSKLLHAACDGIVQAFVFEIDVSGGCGEHTSVCPADAGGAARIKAVITQRNAVRRRDMGYSVVAAIAEEQFKYAKTRIDDQVIACKAAETEGMTACICRYFAQPLLRMPGKAEESQRLTICAVAVLLACPVCANGKKRFVSEKPVTQQRLSEAGHVLPRGKQAGMTAQIASAV